MSKFLKMFAQKKQAAFQLTTAYYTDIIKVFQKIMQQTYLSAFLNMTKL